MITWMAPRFVKEVDITLEQKGSTTLTIAKGVKAHSSAATTLGLLNSSNGKSTSARGNYASHKNEITSDSMSSRLGSGSAYSVYGTDKQNQAMGHYRWTAAQVGEGYKIVITATSGTTTLTDASDSAFEVVESGK
jgi:hypothetical protein